MSKDSNNTKSDNICDVITRFSIINKERIKLNNQIKSYYEPKLIKAAKIKDSVEFDRLLSELPDCPFLLTAYRIGDLHGL